MASIIDIGVRLSPADAARVQSQLDNITKTRIAKVVPTAGAAGTLKAGGFSTAQMVTEANLLSQRTAAVNAAMTQMSRRLQSLGTTVNQKTGTISTVAPTAVYGGTRSQATAARMLKAGWTAGAITIGEDAFTLTGRELESSLRAKAGGKTSKLIANRLESFLVHETLHALTQTKLTTGKGTYVPAMTPAAGGKSVHAQELLTNLATSVSTKYMYPGHYEELYGPGKEGAFAARKAMIRDVYATRQFMGMTGRGSSEALRTTMATPEGLSKLYGGISSGKLRLSFMADDIARGISQSVAGKLQTDVNNFQQALATNKIKLTDAGGAVKEAAPKGAKVAHTTPGSAMERAFVWGAASTAIWGSIGLIGLLTREVAQLDAAFAQLTKSMGSNVDKMGEAKDTIYGLAKKYGDSVEFVTKAYQEYIEQGYNMADAAKYTETALIGANIAGTDSKQMTEVLTAATKQFNRSMNESADFLDIWAMLSRKTRTDLSEIAKGFVQVGSQAEKAGLSVEELSTLIAIGVQATGETGETVGAALRTMFARTQTEGKILPATEKAFQNILGINPKEFIGRFDELLNEIQKKWKQLSLGQKSALASAIGEKRRVQPTIAILDAISRGEYQDRLTDAMKSSGEAARQNEIILQNFEKQLAKMKAALQEFAGKLGAAGFTAAVSGLFKGLTGLLNIFNALPGPIRTVVAAIPPLTAATIGLAYALRELAGFGGGKMFAPTIAKIPRVGEALVRTAGVYASGKGPVEGAGRVGITTAIAHMIKERTFMPEILRNYGGAAAIGTEEAMFAGPAQRRLKGVGQQTRLGKGFAGYTNIVDMAVTEKGEMAQLALALQTNAVKTEQLTLALVNSTRKVSATQSPLWKPGAQLGPPVPGAPGQLSFNDLTNMKQAETTLGVEKGLALWRAKNKQLEAGVTQAVAVTVGNALSESSLKAKLLQYISGTKLATMLAPLIGTSLATALATIIPIALVGAIVAGLIASQDAVTLEMRKKARDLQPALDIYKTASLETEYNKRRGFVQTKEFKNSAEGRAYNKAVSEIANAFPEMVDKINPATGEIKLFGDAIDYVNKKASEQTIEEWANVNIRQRFSAGGLPPPFGFFRATQTGAPGGWGLRMFQSEVESKAEGARKRREYEASTGAYSRFAKEPSLAMDTYYRQIEKRDWFGGILVKWQDFLDDMGAGTDTWMKSKGEQIFTKAAERAGGLSPEAYAKLIQSGKVSPEEFAKTFAEAAKELENTKDSLGKVKDSSGILTNSLTDLVTAMQQAAKAAGIMMDNLHARYGFDFFSSMAGSLKGTTAGSFFGGLGKKAFTTELNVGLGGLMGGFESGDKNLQDMMAGVQALMGDAEKYIQIFEDEDKKAAADKAKGLDAKDILDTRFAALQRYLQFLVSTEEVTKAQQYKLLMWLRRFARTPEQKLDLEEQIFQARKSMWEERINEAQSWVTHFTSLNRLSPNTQIALLKRVLTLAKKTGNVKAAWAIEEQIYGIQKQKMEDYNQFARDLIKRAAGLAKPSTISIYQYRKLMGEENQKTENNFMSQSAAVNLFNKYMSKFGGLTKEATGQIGSFQKRMLAYANQVIAEKQKEAAANNKLAGSSKRATKALEDLSKKIMNFWAQIIVEVESGLKRLAQRETPEGKAREQKQSVMEANLRRKDKADGAKVTIKTAAELQSELNTYYSKYAATLKNIRENVIYKNLKQGFVDSFAAGRGATTLLTNDIKGKLKTAITGAVTEAGKLAAPIATAFSQANALSSVLNGTVTKIPDTTPVGTGSSGTGPYDASAYAANDYVGPPKTGSAKYSINEINEWLGLLNIPMAQAALKSAKSKLGLPYVLGASGPGAYDCSGFVSAVLREAGYWAAGTRLTSGETAGHLQSGVGLTQVWGRPPSGGKMGHVWLQIGNSWFEAGGGSAAATGSSRVWQMPGPRGGYSFAGVPVYHGGNQEYMAMLERGEAVVPAPQVPYLSSIINKLDNLSNINNTIDLTVNLEMPDGNVITQKARVDGISSNKVTIRRKMK